jgi:hypothetical protein
MNKMQIRKAERKKAKLRLGIAAPSGAGKTYSSLLIAYGITGDWSKVGLIDTENGSGDLYAHLGDYSVIPIEAPFKPEKYVQAIKMFEDNGFVTIVADSLSHAWAGEGGLLETVDTMMAGAKNKFTAWREITPMHNSLVNAILQSKCHIIATMRSKTEYVLEDDGKGKKVPKKVGMAPIQREGMEYEFTVMLDLSHEHIANTSKDRTGLFDGQYFKPDVDTGKKLSDWLETGTELATEESISEIHGYWSQLGYKEELLNAQCKKKFGTELKGITEPQALEFIESMKEMEIKQAAEKAEKEKSEIEKLEKEKLDKLEEKIA